MSVVQSTISALNGASAIVKDISDVGVAIKHADLKLQLAKLMDSLADARIKLSQLKVSINDKDEEIQELKIALKMKEKLEFNKDYGLYESEEDGKMIRYCMKCHAEGKFVPVQERDHEFRCKNCNQSYARPEYKSENSPPKIVCRPQPRGKLW